MCLLRRQREMNVACISRDCRGVTQSSFLHCPFEPADGAIALPNMHTSGRAQSRYFFPYFQEEAVKALMADSEQRKISTLFVHTEHTLTMKKFFMVAQAKRVVRVHGQIMTPQNATRLQYRWNGWEREEEKAIIYIWKLILSFAVIRGL